MCRAFFPATRMRASWPFTLLSRAVRLLDFGVLSSPHFTWFNEVFLAILVCALRMLASSAEGVQNVIAMRIQIKLFD